MGGGGGIGKALALGFARQGADVALASRNLEKLEGVAKELQADQDVKTRVKAFQMDCWTRPASRTPSKRSSPPWARSTSS